MSSRGTSIAGLAPASDYLGFVGGRHPEDWLRDLVRSQSRASGDRFYDERSSLRGDVAWASSPGRCHFPGSGFRSVSMSLPSVQRRRAFRQSNNHAPSVSPTTTCLPSVRQRRAFRRSNDDEPPVSPKTGSCRCCWGCACIHRTVRRVGSRHFCRANAEEQMPPSFPSRCSPA